MTTPRMRFECWIIISTNTDSEYVILLAFPLRRWLHEIGSVVRRLPVLLRIKVLLTLLIVT